MTGHSGRGESTIVMCVGCAVDLPHGALVGEHDLLERAEADAGDRLDVRGRQRRVELDRARLQHAERHGHDRVACR